MKEFYWRIIKLLMKTIVAFEIFKVRSSELYAIFRKRAIYKEVNWNSEQIKEFTDYWKENYGRKIKTNGHQLYESINGIYQKDYIPDYIFSTKIEPYLNPYFYAKIYSDKSLTELLYSRNKIVEFPETYLIKSSGIFYDGKRNIISYERAHEILKSLDDAVLKPTVGGNSGKGVLICSFNDGFDKRNNFHIYSLLAEDRDNYIIQERLQQHEQIARIYSDSVNTFRVITYIIDGKIYCADLALRIGSGGGLIDNIHAGGLGIGVKNDGSLLKYAYKLGYSDSKLKFSKHPDTGIVFENYKVPGTSKIIECAKELHGLTPNIGIVSWDFTVSKEENPLLIEANFWGQAVWFTQIVNGKPIFGDHTPSILNKIRQ